MLRCAKPCQCVLSQPVANPHSTGASHQIDQRLRSVSADSTTQIGGGSERARFLRFLFVKSSSHDSLVHILPCQRHLPKAPRACQYHFEVQTELSPQSCTLFVGNFPRSNYEPAETLLRRPQRPRYPEKRGFVLESVFAREFTHFRTVTLPSCLMVGGWHGDVVDMMMGLTWWCGWHNGGNANQDHRPVTRKIFS